MRRFALVAGLCALLISGAMLGARAQVTVLGDADNMDISLRDADLSEVLTAMFNTTNGRYQMVLEKGVVGRIPRLQITQTPFEKALDAVLGSDYSYTKTQQGQGTYLYRISGRQTATPTTNPGGGTAFPTMAPPSASLPAVSAAGTTKSTDDSGFPTLNFPTQSTTSTDKTGTGDKTATSSSATESSVIKLIRVSNLDLASLCTALGFQVVQLFNQTSSNGGTSNGYNSGTNNGLNNGYNNGINNNGINNGINNNNNNNGMYNNNNNNNNLNNNRLNTTNSGTNNNYNNTLLR